MNGMILILGMGIIAFLFTYFLTKLPEEHNFFKFIGVFFIFFFIILMGKAIIDNPVPCENMVNTTTKNITIITGNYTSEITDYTYSEMCLTNTKTTGTTLYLMLLWIFRIFIIYLFIYLLYVGAMSSTKIREWLKRGLGK